MSSALPRIAKIPARTLLETPVSLTANKKPVPKPLVISPEDSVTIWAATLVAFVAVVVLVDIPTGNVALFAAI